MTREISFFADFWAIARYEIIYILRDWFFRISAAVAIILLTIFNIFFYAGVAWIPHILFGLPSFVPYANLVLINVMQVMFIIFIMSDLVRREKQLDSIKVIHAREFSNQSYLLGKFFGIFVIFALLNITVIFIAAIIHLVSESVNFVFWPYIFYFIIISVPSIIFMMGFSFFILITIRNRALVIILLLVYCLLTIFYLGEKHFYLYDFIAFQLPLVYSDFTGITHQKIILLQRGIFFFLGLVFIFLSIITFGRLPQSKKSLLSNYVIVIIALTISFIFIHIFLNENFDRISLCRQMIELNKSNIDKPNISIQSHSINLIHKGNEIEVDSKIGFINENKSALDKIYFYLNPGLKVNKVLHNNQEVSFSQLFHFININLPEPIQSSKSDSIQIYYSGSICDEVSYLDIPEDMHSKPYQIWYYNIDKKYSFLSENYVLLSSENLWYPVTSLKCNYLKSLKRKKEFVKYNLSVKSKEKLTVISQGQKSSPKSGEYVFQPETPLSQISLVIGEYETRTILVDSIKYNLHTYRNHDNFLKFFAEVEDTLSRTIRNLKQEYEQKLGLDYPFKRLHIVEVPIQFYTYPRLWTVTQELVQPEQVWIHENGTLLPTASPVQSIPFLDADFKYYSNHISNKELKIRNLNNFLKNIFWENYRRHRLIYFRTDIPLNYLPEYNIFSNYYTYCYHFFSSEWPIYSASIERFLYNRANPEHVIKKMFSRNLTTGEEVCQQLKKRSFSELLRSNVNYNLMVNLIQAKNEYLNKQILSRIDYTDYSDLIMDIINEGKFSNIDGQQIFKIIADKFEFQLNPILENWYNKRQLPGFIYSDFILTKLKNNKDYTHHLGFEISNPENVEGLVELSFSYSRKDKTIGKYSDDNNEFKIITLDKQQTKKVGILLNAKPRSINVNGLLAQNIPLAFMIKLKEREQSYNSDIFDGEIIIKGKSRIKEKSEIIIDNEDPEFQLIDNSKLNWLTQIFKNDKRKDRGYTWIIYYHDPPESWKRLKNPAFHGKYIHSAFYTAAGDGKAKAIWAANIQQSGNYKVYVYIFDRSKLLQRWDKRKLLGKLNYVVLQEDNITNIELDFQQTDPSEVWNYLGTFYFSEGPLKVELSNKTDGKVVIADAIKFVKN